MAGVQCPQLIANGIEGRIGIALAPQDIAQSLTVGLGKLSVTRTRTARTDESLILQKTNL